MVQVLLQCGAFLLQVVEVTRVDFFRLWHSESNSELHSELVPSVEVAIREVRVLVLSEAFKGKNECFDFACRAASGCFDGRLVLEEEIFWVGVSVELRENSGVEAWRPRELFELCREGRGEALLRTKLMLYHVLSFLFIRVLPFFDENGLLEKPMRLRCLLYSF